MIVVLWWILIGSLVWCALYLAGIIQQTLRRRRYSSRLGIVLASIGVIVGWPVVVGVFLSGVLSSLIGGRVR